MKTLLIIVFLEVFLLCCSSIHKCNSIDTMRQTNEVNNLFLDTTEAEDLNRIFEINRKDFDFTNKKIGFIKGSTGLIKSNKRDYFDMQKKHSINENYPCNNGTLYIFDLALKKESGGYDAAIVYWSKMFIPIEKIVKRLKQQP